MVQTRKMVWGIVVKLGLKVWMARPDFPFNTKRDELPGICVKNLIVRGYFCHGRRVSEDASTRSALQIPVLEVERMDAKRVSLAAVSASLYAVLSIMLAPISFGPIQLRVADALLPLAALFGWPLVFGVTLGCLVGNAVGGAIAFGTISPFDITFGPAANLIAASLIFYFRKRRLVGCVLGSIVIGFIVGGYLWTFIPPPESFGSMLPPWLAMILSIMVSSLVAIAVLGYLVLSVLSRPSFASALKSKGLKVFE